MTPRLALYSDQQALGNPVLDARLLRLIGKSSPRIAYFASSAETNRQYFETARAYYADRGVSLDFYVGPDSQNIGDLTATALQCDAVHLSGGNTYGFLRWLQQHGLLPELRKYVVQGGVLIGVSAGAILMSPNISTAALCGDAPDPLLTDHTSLGLTQFHFLPHFTPTSVPDSLWKPLKDANEPVYACADGGGIIVDAGTVELYGQVEILNGGA
ncbi:Type 1 glutamine amidotransferase-like domain-containing protein [Paracidovorax wautersii]|uniref:Dipeptidase E n=1 Tax=Paracidovorax wautersii TaxID=1177982 RepID=A0A1I2F3D7_9BURK|nr:Type 1 glutamine amidotransferase-like domain-containing protein [Paracidovorax wautersii]SFE99020.1 dipeptidase E [Paracidovorax wautersii]